MPCRTLTAEQLGEMSKFLAFVDQYAEDGTVTISNSKVEVRGDVFLATLLGRWRKVKPIFDTSEEARLQEEVRMLAKLIETKREQMRAQRKARVL